MTELLNSRLVHDLREVINKTNIFVKDPVEKDKFNLICAVMDRFDDSVSYLNNHQNIPISEEEIIIFFHHCCVIKDGIKSVCEILNIKNLDTNIFEKYCKSDPINLLPGEYKGDEKFFGYLRSLFFAHPFITSISIPKPLKQEVQYSPYILNGKSSIFEDSKESLGVMVYSNKRKSFYLNIKFNDIKKYIAEKYLVINDIINAFQNIITQKETDWLKRKVNRNQSSEKILLDIIDILKERYCDYDIIEDLYNYLTCKVSLAENIEIINKYRKEIINSIPLIADCIDNMNYDELYNITSHLIYSRPNEKYPMMYYQLEKIYCYLNDEGYGDVDWGLKQAECFSKEFAKKWVTIDPYNMSFDEIKLLTTIACFYEAKEDGDKDYD